MKTKAVVSHSVSVARGWLHPAAVSPPHPPRKKNGSATALTPRCSPYFVVSSPSYLLLNAACNSAAVETDSVIAVRLDAFVVSVTVVIAADAASAAVFDSALLVVDPEELLEIDPYTRSLLDLAYNQAELPASPEIQRSQRWEAEPTPLLAPRARGSSAVEGIFADLDSPG